MNWRNWKKALAFLCCHKPGASELAAIAQKGSLVMDCSNADAEEVFTDEAALPDTWPSTTLFCKPMISQ